MKKILLAFAVVTSLNLLLNSSRAVSQTSSPTNTVAQTNNQQTGYNCLTREVWSPEKQAWCNKLKTLQNLKYTLPGRGTVSLTNGTSGDVSSPLRATLSTQPEQIQFADVNGDKVEDAVAVLDVTSGKSAGSTSYLVTVLNISNQPQPLTSILIGDRVRVSSTIVREGQIEVTVVTPRTNQPDLRVTRVYKIQPQLTLVNALREELANTEWLLEDLGGSGVVDRVRTTLRFDGLTRITGEGGCNRYFAQLQNAIESEISTADLPFKVGAIGSTRKACPPAVMNQETRYFRALERSQRMSLDGSFLLIYSEGSKQPLKFTQVPVTLPSPVR